MVAKPLCPLYKNIIKHLDRARYPELRYIILTFKITGDKVTSSFSNHQIRFWTLTTLPKRTASDYSCRNDGNIG